MGPSTPLPSCPCDEHAINPPSCPPDAPWRTADAADAEPPACRRGATIQRLLVPDRSGELDDIVLGFDDEAPYKVQPMLGAACTAPRLLPPAAPPPPPPPPHPPLRLPCTGCRMARARTWARSWGGWPTASPTRGSSWMGRATRWPPTTAPTACTVRLRRGRIAWGRPGRRCGGGCCSFMIGSRLPGASLAQPVPPSCPAHPAALTNPPAGGKVGYDKVEWEAQPEASDRGQAVRLTYTSPDGEEASAAWRDLAAAGGAAAACVWHAWPPLWAAAAAAHG